MRAILAYRVKSIVPVVLMACMFLLLSCSNAGAGRTRGAAIPADLPAVKLADVLGAPAGYSGKKVVMKGIVSAQCPSLCEFTFKDGVSTALVFPQGFRFPKLKKGRPVTLYAEITSGSGNIAVTALGLRLE
jgi:hypothetical protein